MPLKNICFFHKKTPLLAILLIGTLSLNTAWADSTAGTTPGCNSDSTADKTPEKIALQNNCNSALLQGAWQLESAIYLDMNGKTLAEIQNQSTKSRKLIAGRHFSFITWHQSGKFEVAASGSFSADSSGYHEQVDATSLPRLQNKIYHFQCQLSGDSWLHQGLEDGVLIKEHWRKLTDIAS
jgi:hypothetical protein